MSKRIPIWCTAVALSLGVGLSAQTSTTKPQIPSGTTIPPSGHAVPQPKVAPPAADPAAPAVNATGCLERWRAAEATAADKGPAGVMYVLTRIEGETSPPKRFLLLPDPKINYAAHLSHLVKIAGTIAPQPSAGASIADAIADPATRETNLPAGEKAEVYQDNLIEVSALTMVARTCGH